MNEAAIVNHGSIFSLINERFTKNVVRIGFWVIDRGLMLI